MYNEEAKNIARYNSLSKAVLLLTEKRNKSTLADRGYLRRVWEKIAESGNSSDKNINSYLNTKTIERWEYFFDSIVTTKEPKHLKIAYLCGPDPLNDLNVLTKLGVLQENIWAIESDKRTYEIAVDSLIAANFPFLKIIRSDFKSFIEYTPIRFDIIYLDFCDTIYSRADGPKNLETITAIAKHQSLASLGILITNFALVSKEQDEKGFELLSKFAAGYLYPKSFLEVKDTGRFGDGVEAEGIYEDEFFDLVKNDLAPYYSQFVTRVIMDIFCLNVHVDRFMNNQKQRNLFFDKLLYKNKPRYILRKKVESLFTYQRNGGGGDIFVDHGSWALPWSFAYFLGFILVNGDDKEISEHGPKFINQLTSYSKNGNDFFEKMTAFYYLKDEDPDLEIFYSNSLKRIAKNWKAFEKHIFCDVFLFHQLKDLMIRQISMPYHINIAKSRRWRYKAKNTEMYMDMLVFDECRYLYDWMPTIDMLKDNLSNIENELSFRYVLDALGKHKRWYFDEFFSGTAIIDQHTKKFRAKMLRKRKEIKTS
ncbi:class I SAM-dependent methyltransferase [Mucilaginibacter sp. Bleaf8]|uniref:class I SAM-dependent methyltransferase n=1 Tax=Mucilaginibacter sp. Bleaf8 TaxID=2834430 RepID=UPI001BCCB8AB|nr:class I SAM-dependent methyltransferase [Mucilaginibacter sp. Bleaf8]MBS7565658.1 class I SAM-dependent methyltransferase [Mucilaginibacter sp. Bleaf8]